VAIVHITHALSNTSHILPVAKICKLAKRFLTITIVDAAQSIGAVEVKTSKWEADFILGTGVKFLCAGPGACFLYASDAMLKICKPVDVGWFSHEDPFEMDIERFRYARDAMRFFGGTPSPQPLAMAISALKLWNEIGLENVQTRIQDHLTALAEELPDEVLISPKYSIPRGASLVVSPKNAHILRNALKAKGIKYDERRTGFRFSVHCYTREDDIDMLKACLKTVV
ncbi:MAG: aminotransferase class V-fold PLP-dependent enzyme, partial [Maricaulaceae bacterium]